MVDLNKNMKSCSHCNSTNMRFYGFTVNNIHYYYECLNCRKFTEYHVTSKKLKLIYLFTLIFYVVVVFSLDTTPLLALSLLLAIIAVSVLSCKYRWSTETIALDRLPDRLIIPALPNKIRYIVITIFSVALLSYIALFIYNRTRH